MNGSLIGIDIGTTAVKAVRIALDGRRMADFAASYRTVRPAPGRVEQDPADWLALVRAALDRLAGPSGPPGPVIGIGLTSQVNTHVFAGRDLQPLAPAMVWQDGRAADAGAAIDAGLSAEDKIAWLGAPIPVDASHALARMAWMAGAHPVLWDRTAHVMLPKDWVAAQLTGQVAADPISAVGLVGTDHCYAAGLIDCVSGAADRLAPLIDPLAVVGAVRAGPCDGVPVVIGLMDAWASLLGLGAAQNGAAAYLSGTSDVLGVFSETRTGAPGVITFPEWRGLVLHAAPTQSGGASLDWVARLTGRATDRVAPAPITATTPLFLPHLEGERAPLWDSATRGSFAGLSTAHGPDDLAAAVLEGVAFAGRLALEAVEASAGRTVAELRFGGGGARSDLWAQIRADALGRRLARMAGTDPGAVGAAILAGAGLGALPDLATAAARLARPDRSFLPDPAAGALADRRFALWQDLYRAARPVNAALSGGAP